jgi:hypothetical protein
MRAPQHPNTVTPQARLLGSAHYLVHSIDLLVQVRVVALGVNFRRACEIVALRPGRELRGWLSLQQNLAASEASSRDRTSSSYG